DVAMSAPYDALVRPTSRSAAGAEPPQTIRGTTKPNTAAGYPSGYSRRGNRFPRLCCKTVHESFHLTRLLKRVVLVRQTVGARAPSSPRGNTDVTIASSCMHLSHLRRVG